MLPIMSKYDLDRESIIQRNKDMYRHFNKLNLIQNRKNLYLPKIKLNKSLTNKEKIKRNNNLILYYIEKNNANFHNKINQIYMRPNKSSLNERIIKNLLKQKKITRENSRKVKLNFLTKTNDKIKKRINNVHPIINHKKLKLEYLESRKIYDLNRKLKPCLSWENNFFTKEDYSYMEKYRNQFSENNKSYRSNKSINNSSSTKKLSKLKKIKYKKLGFSMNTSKIK